ncbi:MAG: helix-turn-helix domain-containing protein [Cyclobacteriaceae bacterium]|nr:helix-turn-helix domain-containing protein [Cyclobacteriaceae bacterium]
MSFNLLSSFYLIGLAQGLLLLFAFLLKKPLTKPAIILSLLVFTITGGMWEGFVLTSQLYKIHPGIFGWFIATPFVIGPLLYAYTISLLEKRGLTIKFAIKHGAIAAIYFAFMLPYIIEDPQMKLVRLKAASELSLTEISIWNTVMILLRTAHWTFYMWLSHKIVTRYKRQWKQISSDNSLLKLNFLSALYWYFILIQVCILVMIMVKEYNRQILPMAIDNIAYLVLIIFLFAIGYWGLNNPGVLFDRLSDPIKTQGDVGLSPAVVNEVAQKLTAVLHEKEWYKNKALRLQHVADEIGFSTHIVSRVINEQFGMPFFDWVNGYRVNEAKKLLQGEESRNFTIERIAHQSGFNNKVSFYKQFRENVGCSPSEFRKKSIEL